MEKLPNLEAFSTPEPGKINVCIINNREKIQNVEHTNLSEFTNRLDKHPKILITSSMIQPTSTTDDIRSLFVPVHTPFLKQLTQVYYEQGVLEALQMASTHHNKILSISSKVILRLYDFIHKGRILLNPSLKYSAPILINELSQTRSWLQFRIRAIAWHPHYTKIAVASCDDTVRIYNEDKPHIPVLRCKQQKNITSLAWRPLTASELAVAHESGIIVWNIDPNSLVTRPSVSNATILYRVNHSPVLSIAWDISGDILISAAACDSYLIAWNVEMNRTSYLKASTGGNILVKMSPNGQKMFSATNSIVFRMWRCDYWDNDRWTVLKDRVQAACWVNKGDDLIFATNTESIIYCLIGRKSVIFRGGPVGAEQAVAIFDVSEVPLNGQIVGGLVQAMESDPNGQHLAILFQDSNCVLLFNVLSHLGAVTLLPSSIIIGMPTEIPCVIAFQQNFKNSACLTIGWSGGRVQYYPIIYTDY